MFSKRTGEATRHTLSDGKKSAGLAGRFLADSQLMLIVICFRKELAESS